MGVQLAGAPALDAYLHNSFELVQYVADNMPAITAVANHLTPVEDLVDFRDTIAELYGKLGLLVEASELIIQTTPAGIQLLLAPDAASQRIVLGLGSAAVKDVGYFAKTTEFAALSAYVDQIKQITDQLALDLADRVTHAELATVLTGLRGEIDGIVDSAMLHDRITAIVTQLGPGEYGEALNQKVTGLTSRVETVEGTLLGQATALQTLSTKVTVNKQGIEAQAADMVALRTDVADAKSQLAGSATALGSLTTRTTSIEGVITSQAEDLTQLTAKADNLASGLGVQSDALQRLTTFAGNTDAAQKSSSAAVTQLGGRITDAESNLAANVEATQQLTTDLQSTQAGLSIAASDVTQLKASITGTGNLLPNSAFEVDTRAWTLFSHGTGWLSAKLQMNLDADRLPQGLNVLSWKATGVPPGTSGVRSARLPISAQTRYILSGYMAAENCTLQMEWRLFDAGGVQIGMGVVGAVTNKAPANNLVNWQRVFKDFQTSVDAALLEVQLWAKDCNTAPPKVWFLRPMMEEAVGTQTEPSPWVPSVVGLEETVATAMTALTTRVESTEAGLLASSESVTKLQARIGNVVTWRVVSFAGSGNAASVGAPLEASIRVASKNAADYSLQRGLTLVRFTVNGELASTTRFDTYASAAERTNLTAALNALGPNDGFLLVSQDNHGVKVPALTAALERCGALNFVNVVGSKPYALRGRGGIGKGAGLENYPLGENQFIDFTFSTSNDMPQGLGEQGMLAGVADAVQTLTTTVTQIDGRVLAAADASVELAAHVDDVAASLSQESATRATADSAIVQDIHLLGAHTEDKTAFLLDQSTVKVDSTTTLAQQLAQLKAADADSQSAIAEEATARTSADDALAQQTVGLSTRVGTAESALVSDLVTQVDKGAAIATLLNNLGSRLSDAETGVAGVANAADLLTTRVTQGEGGLLAQSQQLTGLKASLDGVQEQAATSAEAISSLTVQVGDIGNGLSSQATALTTLTTKVGGQQATITSQQSSIEGLRLKAGVTLDANGHVTGWEINNDGRRGGMVITADTFQIVPPDGTEMLAWQGGNLIASKGGFMKVTGAGFGASGNLIEWFGAAMPANACTVENAVWCTLNDGSVIFNNGTFRGDLSARSITGAITVSATVDWAGSIGSQNGGGSTPAFVCPAPLRPGEQHRPEICVELALGRGGGTLAAGVTVALQRKSNGGSWGTIATRGWALNEYQSVSNAFIFLDALTASEMSYRFNIAASASRDSEVTLSRVSGRVLGQRIN